MDRTYSGSYGRLKVYGQEFFRPQFYDDLMSKNVDEITQALMSTAYRDDIEMYLSLFKKPDFLEMAFNRMLARRNGIAMSSPPPSSSSFLKTYFTKWDIENIKAVIASKILGYRVSQSETYIMSFRDIPLGMYSGIFNADDYRVMINLGSVEEIIEYLARAPIGTYLLQYLDSYRKTKDTAPLFSAMDRYYYSSILSSSRFYNGDESVVRRYFREEIDSRNIILIMKAVDLHVSWDDVRNGVIPEGFMQVTELEELHRLSSVTEIAQRLKDKYDLEEASSTYEKEGLLYGFEVAMRHYRYSLIETMKSLSSSLAFILSFVLKAELERDNLRSIVLGKNSGLPDEKIRELLFTEVFN